MGRQGEGLGMFISVCSVGALLVVTLFLNSELVVGAATELWATEKLVAGDGRPTVVDTEGEAVI